MEITCLSLSGYRNLSEVCIYPDKSANIIHGNNAQGKTNLLEAMWLFTGNQSFRGSRYNELIAFDNTHTSLSIGFHDTRREQNASIDLDRTNGGLTKRAILNGVPLKRISELNGCFYAVVFSPVHLGLITDGPKARRRFLDIGISQVKPQYKDSLVNYDKLLIQRNSLIKQRPHNIAAQLEAWDIQLARVGTLITCYRKDYIKKLEPIAKHYYCGISSNSEGLGIAYGSTVFDDLEQVEYNEQAAALYYDKLVGTVEADLRQGYTTCGIHRDELEFTLDGISVREYGSQGQQRSVVITLKLGEAELLKRVTKENPIILLDDVMSELDELRQDYILNHLEGMQTFITCCDKENVARLKAGGVFEVVSGSVST